MKIWSNEEIQQLKDLRESGKSPAEIAIALNRSYDSVELKLRRVLKSTSSCTKLYKPPNTVQKIEKKLFNVFSVPDDVIRTVWMFDSHFPHNLPIAPLIKFCRDLSPHIFGFGGDNWSLDCISHWNEATFKNKGMDNVLSDFNKEASAFKNHISMFLEALPNTKFVYILGNHEDWLDQFCQSFPQAIKPTVQNILGEFSERIEFIPRGGFYEIGKLHFAHGDQFGTANPAKQAVERTNKTIVFGHHHVYKVWPQFSMVDEKEKHLGIAVPCFCGLAPGYGKGRPNQWMNGFFAASVKRKSGNFTPYVIPVGPKGNFITIDGKEYF